MSRRTELAEQYGERVPAELDNVVSYLDELRLVVAKGEQNYLSDVLTQRAVEGILNRVGDTIRNRIPQGCRERFGGEDHWSSWVGLRIVVTHKYHRINLTRIWLTLVNDAPEFRSFVKREVLGELDHGSS